MRCILVILDGIGDRGQECFEGRTPLQVASTPNMDRLASQGMNGLYHSLMQGVAMSSEIAHFLIFGYDIEDFPGRGILEAIGEGIKVSNNDVAVLCHLCSVKEIKKNLVVTHGYPELDATQGHELMKEIRTFKSDGVRINLIYTRKTDGILVLKGDISEEVTDSDPIYEGRAIMKIMPTVQKRKSSASNKTASVLNRYLIWCYQKLSLHRINKERKEAHLPPVNALVTNRAGKRRKLMSFRDRWGLRGLSVAASPIYWGLCAELGMDTVKVKDTGNIEEDLKYRLRLAKDAIDYEFIHVHTKMPDEAGHTKNPRHKKDVIEVIDRAMSVAVNEIITDSEVLLVVTSDHCTACSGSMIHTGETVPLTVIGRYTRKDEVEAFNENSCSRGGLGVIRGKELMFLILNFLDRAKMQGLMDTPANQPYYPGNYKPLRL